MWKNLEIGLRETLRKLICCWDILHFEEKVNPLIKAFPVPLQVLILSEGGFQ
jgi:hypothetical protein